MPVHLEIWHRESVYKNDETDPRNTKIRRFIACSRLPKNRHRRQTVDQKYCILEMSTTVGSLPVHDVIDIKANVSGDRCVLSTLTNIIVCAVPVVGTNDVIKRAQFAEVHALAVGTNTCVFFVRDVLYRMNLYTGQTDIYMRCPPGTKESVRMLLLPQDDIVLGVTEYLIRLFSPNWYNGTTNRVKNVPFDGTDQSSTMPTNVFSAGCNSSMLLLQTLESVLYIYSIDTHVSGFKWYTAGTGTPENGKEVKNDALTTALKRGTTRNRVFLTEFKMEGLTNTHFVRYGTDYLRPAMDGPPQLQTVATESAVHTYALSEHFYAYNRGNVIVVCNLQGQETFRHAIAYAPLLRELQVSQRGDIAFNDARGNTVVQPIDSTRRVIEPSLTNIVLVGYTIIGRGVDDVRSLLYRDWDAEVRARLLSSNVRIDHRLKKKIAP